MRSASSGAEAFASATHVVVDVSGLPNTIYFPLVGSILTAVDDGRFDGEMQVTVCENPLLDGLIVGAGVGGVSPIAGFKHGLDVESEPDEIRVWAPVIGERAGAQLAAIRQHLDPREVCPVLPFPARDPRRADRLFLEHRELLVDTLEVEPANFIYADERNPFDLYRGLSQLHARYGHALRPLGASRIVTSVHASKMLSLGALLAAFEHRLSVLHVETVDYSIEDVEAVKESLAENRLACLWLSGTPTAT